jgi:hypothetical protein
LAYYLSLTAFEILAVRLKLPPFLAGWGPNLLFGALGIYLLIKAANETPFKLSIWLIEGMDTIKQKWKRIFEDV